MTGRLVTIRRTVQQIKHCVDEALAVIENEEDAGCAIDDLQQAYVLIEVALKRFASDKERIPRPTVEHR
jgi:hypothetical protein